MTVHSMPSPGADAAQRRTRVGRIKMLLVLAACAAPVVASYLSYFVIRPEGRTNYGQLILPTRSLPALALQRPDGSAVSAASLKGQWLLVVVAGADCDATCEKLLYTQRQLREMLGRERDRVDKLWLVTGTAAPGPALQAALAGAVPVTALRASREQVAAWLQPAAGQRLEDHLYVVDPMGEWMMRAPIDLEPARLRRDLDRLLRASSFWDRAGR